MLGWTRFGVPLSWRHLAWRYLSIENYTLVARTEKSVPLARSLRDFPLRESRCFSVECSIVSDTCARFVDTKEKWKLPPSPYTLSFDRGSFIFRYTLASQTRRKYVTLKTCRENRIKLFNYIFVYIYLSYYIWKLNLYIHMHINLISKYNMISSYAKYICI